MLLTRLFVSFLEDSAKVSNVCYIVLEIYIPLKINHFATTLSSFN